MNALPRDLRHTLRMMRAQPAFTAAALITLALGIGATTAIFSVVRGVLLQPLPYPAASRLVAIAEDRGLPGPSAIMINYTFHAWREAPTTIDGLAAYSGRAYTATGRADPERLRGAAVSPELFDMLGVTPALGRFLAAGSEAPGVDPTVVISYRLWQERFGADPSAIGRPLLLDGRAHTVVGVARPDFYFPDRDARLWTPYAVPPRSANPNEIRIAAFSAIARLAPGATPEQAAAEGTAAAVNSGAPPILGGPRGPGGPAGPRARRPGGPGPGGPGGPGVPGAADPASQAAARGPVVRVDTLVNTLTSRVRPALLVLSVGVVFVLLISCANVANLFLSRGVARERELAVRAALGANRRRLLGQLLAESVALALAGGVLGLFLGWALTRLLPVAAPADFPRLDDIRVDGVVLAFAAVASIAAGLLSGSVPALRASRVDLVSALRDGAGASAGLRMTRLRAGLLVAEAALAVMLLIGAGLLIRSFVGLVRVDAGYTVDNVLTAQAFLPVAGGAGPPQASPAAVARTLDFAGTLLTRLRAVPGVSAAGAGNLAPLGGAMTIGAFDLPGAFGPDGAPVVARATEYSVTSGYAEALGLRLRGGRLLVDADRASAIRPFVVSESFVRAYLTDDRPVVGRRFEGLAGPGTTVELIVKTDGDPAATIPALRSLVREADPGAALDAVGPLAARVAASVGQPRFVAALLGAFAVLALVLAAIGLYGVLSYNVTRRRREIGVRLALGASRADIRWLVVGQALCVTAVGLVLGIAGAAAATRLMQELLFGVTPLDWVSFTVAPLVLLVVALVACLAPARRAAGADPAQSLRCE